jgi:hypothetical protein
MLSPRIENKPSLADLKGLIEERWPKSCRLTSVAEHRELLTPSLLTSLVPQGIPAGQLLNICGGASSGKTSFLFKLLSDLGQSTRIAYFDFSGSFHPVAAASSGNDLDRFLIVHPETIPAALRAAEIMLDHDFANCLTFDLVNQQGELSRILLHRLRHQANRAKVLVIFLTDHNSNLIPASLVSLRLSVRKVTAGKISVSVTRSRISPEGITEEFYLHEL